VVRSNAVFLPLLIEQGHGHIVNTASFAGLFTYSYDRLPYAAAKAAIVQISEGLRLYLHPRGVGVTVLCPGPVMTNIMASMPPGFGPDVATRGPGEQFTPLQPEIVGDRLPRRSCATRSWSTPTTTCARYSSNALRIGMR
jgi:NAD(P)-dependent dehydrogenase (short-subunit alcohol dehydrogenase family)